MLHSVVASIIGVAGVDFRLSLILNAIRSKIFNTKYDIYSIAKDLSLFSLILKYIGEAIKEGRIVAL